MPAQDATASLDVPVAGGAPTRTGLGLMPPLLPLDDLIVVSATQLPTHRQQEELCRWASAMGRALHAETALLLPNEAWYGRKITLARRVVADCTRS